MKIKKRSPKSHNKKDYKLILEVLEEGRPLGSFKKENSYFKGLNEHEVSPVIATLPFTFPKNKKVYLGPIMIKERHTRKEGKIFQVYEKNQYSDFEENLEYRINAGIKKPKNSDLGKNLKDYTFVGRIKFDEDGKATTSKEYWESFNSRVIKIAELYRNKLDPKNKHVVRESIEIPFPLTSSSRKYDIRLLTEDGGKDFDIYVREAKA
jgi:hypothetical protein